ncbi:MAG: TIGR01777 family oxidoreductase [Planctomycetota bacterium]|jgi:uncharacterized protein (TIGR01777 family)
MRLFITGATGLLGRRLVADRLARGDEIQVLSRDATRARGRLPEAVGVVEGDPSHPGPWQQAIDGQDAVIHLAGAGIADRRWTPSYKRLLQTSRIDSSHQVVEAIRQADVRPRVLVAASAVGFYGDGGDAELDERSPVEIGDFLGDLCHAWEQASAPARDLGVRVVHLRIGLVLAPEGGMLGQLVPIFRLCLGGPIGRGRAWMPWVHWADVVGLIDHALRTGQIDGPMNATSPRPVRNAEFSRALGRALGRPSLLPVPPPALRLALGELARHAMASQRVVPRRALATGYRFAHGEIDEAMRSVFTPGAGAVDPAEGPQPPSHLDGGPDAVAADASDREPSIAGPPIRMLAVPLEGGLLVSGRMPAGAIAACRAAAESGCRVVLASGRPPRAARPAAAAIGVVDTLIACNGALIWDLAGEQAIHHEPLDAATAAAAVAAVRAASPESFVGIERLDAWYTDRVPETLQAEAGTEAGDAAMPSEIGPLPQWLRQPVTQLDILVPADDVAEVRRVLDPLVSARRLARFERSGGLFQLTHPRAEKAVALQRLARDAGVPREQVMAVGCGRHDAGMIEWAGLSVATADAPESVRRLARVVVPDRAGGGVARAVARYVVSGPLGP